MGWMANTLKALSHDSFYFSCCRYLNKPTASMSSLTQSKFITSDSRFNAAVMANTSNHVMN
jgi:hypothetical protein